MHAACLACGLALFQVASATAADEEDPVYARSGPYVQAYATYAIENFQNEFPNGYKLDDAAGISGRVGYRIDRYFSVEAEFQWIDSFDVSGVDRGDLDTFAGTLNAKAYLLPSRFQPFLVMGIGAVHFDLDTNLLSEDSTSFLFKGGGGFDVYVTEHFVLGFEVTYSVTDGGDFDDFEWTTVGAGLQYRF